MARGEFLLWVGPLVERSRIRAGCNDSPHRLIGVTATHKVSKVRLDHLAQTFLMRDDLAFFRVRNLH